MVMPKTLSDKVVSLMGDPAAAAAAADANRRRAEENFAISRMVAAYEDLWESLVNEAK